MASPMSQALATLNMTRRDLERHAEQMRSFLSTDAASLRALSAQPPTVSGPSSPSPTPAPPIKREPSEHFVIPSLDQMAERSVKRRKDRRADRERVKEREKEKREPIPTASSSSNALYRDVFTANPTVSMSTAVIPPKQSVAPVQPFATNPPMPFPPSSYYQGPPPNWNNPYMLNPGYAPPPMATAVAPTTPAQPAPPPPRSRSARPPPRVAIALPPSSPPQPLSSPPSSSPIYDRSSPDSRDMRSSSPVTPVRPRMSTGHINSMSSPVPFSSPPSDPSALPFVLPDTTPTHQKPPYSYAAMIGQAILASHEKKLSLNQIYTFISLAYPFYIIGECGWQNSIRHNLSLNGCFIKLKRDDGEKGKGSLWGIRPEDEECFEGGGFVRKNGVVARKRKPKVREENFEAEGSRPKRARTTARAPPKPRTPHTPRRQPIPREASAARSAFRPNFVQAAAPRDVPPLIHPHPSILHMPSPSHRTTASSLFSDDERSPSPISISSSPPPEIESPGRYLVDFDSDEEEEEESDDRPGLTPSRRSSSSPVFPLSPVVFQTVKEAESEEQASRKKAGLQPGFQLASDVKENDVPESDTFNAHDKRTHSMLLPDDGGSPSLSRRRRSSTSNSTNLRPADLLSRIMDSKAHSKKPHLSPFPATASGSGTRTAAPFARPSTPPLRSTSLPDKAPMTPLRKRTIKKDAEAQEDEDGETGVSARRKNPPSSPHKRAHFSNDIPANQDPPTSPLFTPHFSPSKHRLFGFGTPGVRDPLDPSEYLNDELAKLNNRTPGSPTRGGGLFGHLYESPSLPSPGKWRMF